MWLLYFQGSPEVSVQLRDPCGFPLQMITEVACESELEGKIYAGKVEITKENDWRGNQYEGKGQQASCCSSVKMYLMGSLDIFHT